MMHIGVDIGVLRRAVSVSSSSSCDGLRPLHDLCAAGVPQPGHLAVAVRADADLDDDMRRPWSDERRDVCGGEPREQLKGRPSLRVVVVPARTRP